MPGRLAPNHSPDLLGQLLKSRAEERPPPVPNDWSKRPGLLAGRLAPWGSLDDAHRLIAFGKIDEGRALMRRLVDTPTNAPSYDKYLAAYCGEMIRPPRETEALDRAEKLPVAEKYALMAILDFMSLDAKRGQDAMVSAMERYPTTDCGAALLLTAVVAWSDVYLQAQILYPLKRAMKFMVTIAPVYGMASLLQRQYEVAWTSFSKGMTSPNATLQTYEKELSVSLDEKTEVRLANLVRIYCWFGQALVLRELCFEAEARAHFGALADALASTGYEFTDTLRAACALLSP